MVVGQIFHASQTVLEEYLVKRGGGQDPLYLMGCEGLWGLLITLTILVLTSYTPCPFPLDKCVNGHIDDASLAMSQFAASAY